MSHQYNLLDKGVRDQIVAPSIARTVSENFGPYVNRSATNILLLLDVTASTTGTLAIIIAGLDISSNKYKNIYVSSSIGSALVQYAFALGNSITTGAPAAAGLNSGFATGLTLLPNNFRITISKSDASSWTYSMAMSTDGLVEAV